MRSGSKRDFDDAAAREGAAAQLDEDAPAAAAAITPIAEYYGVMIGQDKRTDELASPTNIFRGYSDMFSANDRQVLQSFADQAAIAVHNAQLYQQVSREKQRLLKTSSRQR